MRENIINPLIALFSQQGEKEVCSMSKIVKAILLPVLLATILVLFSFYGCGGGGTLPSGTASAPMGGTPAAELNQQQLEQKLADSLASYEELNSYKFDMEMKMFADVSGGAEPGKMDITSKISGAINMALQQMQMKMDMTMDTEGISQPNQNMSYDMYIMPD
jgi:hypothetical protein